MTNVFYSVGQNATDHKTGTPTCTISAGVLTFSVAQTATNLGVGDRITYDTAKVCYISLKVSTTVWNVVTATGATPSDEATPKTVNSVAHEYTSLSAATAGAIDSNHLNTADLVTATTVLNFPCYYDSGEDTAAFTIAGYTTSAQYFIKVYTPKSTNTECNQRQRHSGIWSATKYVLNGGASDAFNCDDNNIKVIGLQIKVTNTYRHGLMVGSGLTGILHFEENILVGAGATNGGSGIRSSTSNTATLNIKNNIIYDWDFGFWSSTTIAKVFYIYNNTIMDCSTLGIRIQYNLGTQRLKNNLCNGNATDYGLSNNGSATKEYINNISEDTTSPNASFQSKAVTFVDEAANNFHLSTADTNAKAAGTDLSNDTYYPLKDDIDGGARGLVWDIGADQISATKTMYSVGQNATDHKTGTPTCTISAGVLTFSVAQTATNLGVGDRITYNTVKKCYIIGKTSSTVWNVRTAKGEIPDDEGSALTVNSIAHEYTSLSGAIAGAIDRDHLDSENLVISNIELYFPCYYDSGFDTNSAYIEGGWITGQDYFIKIFTPNNTNTECNLNQRHSGKWKSSGAFTQKCAYHGTQFNIGTNHVFVIGIQFSNTGTSSYCGVCVGYIAGYFSVANTGKIEQNIIRAEWTNRAATSGQAAGIGLGTSATPPHHFLSNNIIYDFYRDSNDAKGIDGNSYTDSWNYNNTIHNCDIGITGSSDGDNICKNNIVQDCDTCYSGTFLTGSCNNNSSDDETEPGSSGRHGEVLFVDEAADDFHLSTADTIAKGYGANLTSDSDYPITMDIDGNTRPAAGSWDMGADEIFLNNRDHVVGAGVGRGVSRRA